MEETRYQRVQACLRAQRFVVAYRPGPDWIYSARQVVASLNRFWGGAGATVLPVNEVGEVEVKLLRLLRAYDPDIVATHRPTFADLAHSNPDVREEAIRRYRTESEEDSETWSRISGELLNDGDWKPLVRKIDSWCSPLKGVDPDSRSVQYEMHPVPHRDDWTNDLNVLPVSPEEKLIELDLASTDPVLSLMIESRIGALMDRDREGLEVLKLPVEDEDVPHLIRLAIEGWSTRTGWNLHSRYLAAAGLANSGEPPSALTIKQFLARTPIARTRRWLTTAQVNASEAAPIVCVIGDTATDHALALTCDRLFRHGAWVPLSVMRDEAHRRTVKTAIQLLAYSLNAPDRTVLVTSSSEEYEVIREFLPEVERRPEETSDRRSEELERRLEWVSPNDLPLTGERKILVDPEWYSWTRRVHVREDGDGVSLLAPLDLPLPRAAEHLSPDMRWQVDVSMPTYMPPARTSLPSRILQELPGGFPDTVARASRYGISYCSANMGFVPAGAPIEGRLAKPLLRFPSAEQVFAALASARSATIVRSDAGRRASNVVGMWGSLDNLVADLQGPTRSLLDAFIPSGGKKTGDYGSGYAIRGDGYLNFRHANAALGEDEELTRNVLDRMLNAQILRRGFLLNCERCRWQAFYSVDIVGSHFTCQACSHSNRLMHGRWYKGEPEPTWNYSLDQIVRDLLRQNGDLPLLASAKLKQGARDFLWAPELIIEDSQGQIELDICLLIDGQIVIGEAKSNGKLVSSDNSNEQAAFRLVRAAHLLTSDQIVLATSRTSWAPGALAAVKAALEGSASGGEVPTPELVTLEGLGQ